MKLKNDTSVNDKFRLLRTRDVNSYYRIKFLKLPQERKQDNFTRRVRWVENLLAATESMSVKMCDIQ